MTSHIRLAAVLAGLAVVAAACGGATTEPDEPATADLPINPAAACIETEPDCQDTIDTDEPLFIDDEPRDGVEPPVVVNGGALVPGGGLTISDALAGDDLGIFALKGFVVADDGGPHLCELLAESLPPQCGGATVELASLDMIDPDELSEAQGVTWSDQPITLVGEIANGVFTPTPFSQ